MNLLARATTQHFSNPTNNHLRTSSNTINQAIVQGDRVNIQSRNSGTAANVQCYNYSEKGHYARNCPKLRVQDSKCFIEQMFLAKQDEARVILTDEHNAFLFADASRMEEIEELNLEARAKKNEDVVLKNGNSLQGMFMLGPKPMSFYDSNLKHDSKIHVFIRDTEDILDDATKSHKKNDPIAIEKKKNKFISTVRFGNDITGYGDYVQGNITVFHVYYVKGLGHSLFSVGQFCDGDLEVAFSSKTCYVRNLVGDDLLTGARKSNLYTISIYNMVASLPVCLMSKATLTKSWLWHHRLSHLNFSTINDLTKHDLVDGLPKFKYDKDHLCSACERGKSKKSSHPLNVVPSNHSKLKFLHMDLRRPMRVASINEKKYILMIVDDYYRFTWDSGFELIAFSDANHAGCKDDCKITLGGLQFLGEKLVSWSSKKKDYTAMSTAEA
nr:retrovirus-related Pol polyprotein from transposon TNT 1-94 [Tanacetum cinerariifolium]